MKKGQAAMEFIMTYGWAILVVLAAIGALAYFGVLNPANLLPEKCFFAAGTDCIEKASVIYDGSGGGLHTMTVVLKNSLGYSIYFDELMTISLPTGDGCSDVSGSTTTLNDISGVMSDGTPAVASDVDLDTVADEWLIDNGGTVVLTADCPDMLGAGKRFKSGPSFIYTSVDTNAVHVITGDVQARIAAG
ncbi:MAG: hypothetical protein ABIH34_06610 [Nanoarchaeota archaeon]